MHAGWASSMFLAVPADGTVGMRARKAQFIIMLTTTTTTTDMIWKHIRLAGDITEVLPIYMLITTHRRAPAYDYISGSPYLSSRPPAKLPHPTITTPPGCNIGGGHLSLE